MGPRRTLLTQQTRLAAARFLSKANALLQGFFSGGRRSPRPRALASKQVFKIALYACGVQDILHTCFLPRCTLPSCQAAAGEDICISKI